MTPKNSSITPTTYTNTPTETSPPHRPLNTLLPESLRTDPLPPNSLTPHVNYRSRCHYRMEVGRDAYPHIPQTYHLPDLTPRTHHLETAPCAHLHSPPNFHPTPEPPNLSCERDHCSHGWDL